MSGENEGLDPREALSPRTSWQLVDVLHEGKLWSMALGRWKDDQSWRPVLAQRWNGGRGEKGSPASHGYPNWFVLPDETYELYVTSRFISNEKRDYVRQFLNL